MFNLFADKKLKMRFLKRKDKSVIVVDVSNVSVIHSVSELTKLSNITEKEYKKLMSIK